MRLIAEIEQEMRRAGLPLATPDVAGWPGDFEIAFEEREEGLCAGDEYGESIMVNPEKLLSLLRQQSTRSPWVELEDEEQAHERLQEIWELLRSVEVDED